MDKAGLYHAELLECYEEAFKPKPITIPYVPCEPYRLGDCRKRWQQEFANKMIDWGYKLYTEFNKDMLKSGMLVQYRNGALRKVHKGNNDLDMYISNPFDGEFNELDNYDFELKADLGYKELDIIKIYEPKSKRKYFSFDVADHNLIWERKEDTTFELTMQEIADKFNVNVNDLRIKDQ